MVSPIYTRRVAGIVGYRPRMSWFILQGTKIILQVCEKIEMCHPLTEKVVASHTIWRDATVEDFIPPTLPTSQMALAI